MVPEKPPATCGTPTHDRRCGRPPGELRRARAFQRKHPDRGARAVARLTVARWFAVREFRLPRDFVGAGEMIFRRWFCLALAAGGRAFIVLRLPGRGVFRDSQFCDATAGSSFVFRTSRWLETRGRIGRWPPALRYDRRRCRSAHFESLLRALNKTAPEKGTGMLSRKPRLGEGDHRSDGARHIFTPPTAQK